MKKQYDLIFGIGEACSCTQALRKYELQICSFPCDWIFGADYIKRCKILASKFDRFIEKEDLEDTGKNNSDEKNLCEIYHNKYNEINFNHDFPVNTDFNDAINMVQEKYTRRTERLLNQIENSPKILIVYIETPTAKHIELNDETIIEGYNIIKSVFKQNIDLLYISNSAKENKTDKISDNITKITKNYKSKKPNDLDYAVDMRELGTILKNYKLNLPNSYYIKKRIIKILANCIPVKSYRNKIRKKYHI